MHLITKSLVSFLVVASVLAPAIAARSIRDGSKPVVFSVSPTTAHPGDTILCTVTLDGTATSDVSVSISSFAVGTFSSVPSTVTVASGDDHVSFYATISTTASGSAWLTASANGGSVMSPIETITP